MSGFGCFRVTAPFESPRIRSLSFHSIFSSPLVSLLIYDFRTKESIIPDRIQRHTYRDLHCNFICQFQIFRFVTIELSVLLLRGLLVTQMRYKPSISFLLEDRVY